MPLPLIELQRILICQHSAQLNSQPQKMGNILLFLALVRPLHTWMQADSFVHLSRTCADIFQQHARTYAAIAQSFNGQINQVQWQRPPDIYNWFLQLERPWPLWTSILGHRAHEILATTRAQFLVAQADNNCMKVTLKVWHRWVIHSDTDPRRRRAMVRMLIDNPV